MSYFLGRRDAGKQLATALSDYKDRPDTIVLALPRGGVPVGDEIAKELHLPLNIIVPRKIGAPEAEEVAIGAITETGEGIFDEEAFNRYAIDPEYVEAEIRKQTKEAKRRIAAYRGNRPLPDLANKTVIITDDGIATGFTMQAALKSVKKSGAKQVIIAVPVAPPNTVTELKALVDEVIVLFTPERFMAVGQFYADFAQTSDAEVIEIMGKNQGTN